MAPPLRVRRLAGRFFWMIEHQRPLLPQSSFVIRRSPMVGNMAQQSHSSCVGKYGSNPDFLLGGRTSASADCRHWSTRTARWLRNSALASTHAGLRKLRPHFRVTFAAGGADEVGLDVRQPDMIGPAVGADGDVVAA